MTQTQVRLNADYPRASVVIIPTNTRQTFTFIIDEESVDAISDGLATWEAQKNELRSKESSR